MPAARFAGGLAALFFAATASPAFAETFCDRLLAFEQAPFEAGRSSRTIELRWLIIDGPAVTCSLPDALTKAFCDDLLSHSSREYGHPLAIRLLECNGYRVPGVVLDRVNLPLFTEFELDGGRRVRIETAMHPGQDRVRLTISAGG